MKIIIFGSLILLFSFKAFAASTTASEIILLPDGNIILADVFIKQDIDTPDNRPKEISLNPRLNLQIKMYVQFISKQIDKIEMESPSVWYDPFKGLGESENGYRFYVVRDVKELRKYCPPGIGKNYFLPGGINIQDAVCTSGNETYFVEPIFTELNINEQALILIHERLTLWRDDYGGRNLKNVGQLVNGLRKYLGIAFEQQKKQYRVLSEAELLLIKSFFYSYVYLFTHNTPNSPDIFSANWDLHSNGGGLLFNAPDISTDSFISAQSALSKEVNVTGPATIIDSVLIGRIIINGKSVINNSTMGCLNNQCLILIGQNSSIENSKINVFTLELGKNSSIKDSEMAYVRVKTGAGFNMSRAKILLDARYNEEGVFQINANQELKNGEITALEFPDYVPYGVELEYPVLQFTDQKTSCFDENTADRYDACFVSAWNVPSFPYTSVNDGLEIIMTKADVQKNSREINGHDSRIRTFDATIRFSESEKSNPKGKFMILDGAVVRLGSYRTREYTNYAPNFLKSISPHIENELRKIGGSMRYGSFLLPIKASR